MNTTLFAPELFATDLIAWFRRAHRDMPWRLTQDPYCIMVSEFMLQQTQVITVIPYYIRFIQRFPTLQTLAAADAVEVLSYWAGLGYYSRVRNLQSACEQIVQQHGGVFPRDYASIRALKGVGDYTAGAIRSIAFGQATPAVDGNVMRVFARLMSDSQDIALEKTKKFWREQLTQWMDYHHPSEYTQGLMELGAMICTPKNPQCLHCPVHDYCSSFHDSTVSNFPVKLNHTKIKREYFIAHWIQNEQQVLIEQRPVKGLLASQWQLPMTPINEDESLQLSTQTVTYQHQFSHRLWTIHLQMHHDSYVIDSAHQKWIDISQMNTHLITAHQRLLAIQTNKKPLQI